MKLYTASTTEQRQIFAYRKTETDRLIQIPINHGDQMMVLGGTTEEIDAVVQHHWAYGLTDSTKIGQSQAFVGLCCSFGKLVSVSVVEKAVRDNNIYFARGAHGCHQTPVAAPDSSLHDSGTGYSGEMEVSAEQAKGREDSESIPIANETIVAEKTGSKKK